MTRPEDQPRGGTGNGREHWYRPHRPEDLMWAPGAQPAERPSEEPPVGPAGEQPQPGSPQPEFPQQQGFPQPPVPPQQPYAQYPPPGEAYQPGPGEPFHPGPAPAEDHTHLSFPEPEPPQRYVIGPGYENQGYPEQGYPEPGHPEQGYQQQPGPPPPSPVLPGPDPMQPPASAYHPASAYQPGTTPVSASHPMSQASAPHPMSQASAPMPLNQPSATYPPQPGTPGGPPAGAKAVPNNKGKRNTNRAIAALVIGAVALAGVLLFGISQFQRASQSTASSAAAKELSRPAPPGWSQRFVWSTEIPVTGSVAVLDNRVAYIDGAGVLRVLNADTGQAVLTSTTNSVTKDAKPFLAVTQGVPVSGIVDGTNLLLWRLDNPGEEPRTITLAPKALLHSDGGGLLVSTGSEFWVVNAAGALAPVTLPPDHVALAATPDGNLLSSPPRGGWTINSPNQGTAPREVRPERTPDGTVGDMQVAWSARGVIAAWGDTADPARRTVALFDADSGKLLASGTLATDVVKSGLRLIVSPNREFASAGPLLARLSDGRTEVVDRWSSTLADAKNLYGTRDGNKMFWNGELQPLEMDAKAVVPWGMSAARYAIVMDPVDSTRVRLGALAEG
ncbi:chromosomal replication initiator protein DnaA [Enemella evansiae]|uniref:hypothetical protein n=1 Tax=Enemella evansiae TaxID=2016499 RepID=UPI0010D1642D|nr:hypothetical protein [Enemella evansiae]TDO93246.1 hypothetical protein C8D81_1026 [Enemella evansiae]